MVDDRGGDGQRDAFLHAQGHDCGRGEQGDGELEAPGPARMRRIPPTSMSLMAIMKTIAARAAEQAGRPAAR